MYVMLIYIQLLEEGKLLMSKLNSLAVLTFGINHNVNDNKVHANSSIL